MTYEEMEKLARTGDVSTEAVGFRLRVARMSLRPKVSQKAMAEIIGQPNTTYATWETGGAMPPIHVLRYFYLNHRIDFNFLLYGSFSQLPGDVKDALFEAMQAQRPPGGPRRRGTASPKSPAPPRAARSSAT